MSPNENRFKWLIDGLKADQSYYKEKFDNAPANQKALFKSLHEKVSARIRCSSVLLDEMMKLEGSEESELLILEESFSNLAYQNEALRLMLGIMNIPPNKVIQMSENVREYLRVHLPKGYRFQHVGRGFNYLSQLEIIADVWNTDQQEQKIAS